MRGGSIIAGLSDPAPSDDSRPLGHFLRARRQRLDPNIRFLGGYERLSVRWGKPVTQEEMAEALEVSRVWYGALESGSRARASMSLIDRLAAILMLDTEERNTLFGIALPEMKQMSLQAQSHEALGAFPILRSTAKRLWNATTEVEALLVAAERLAAVFPDAHLVFYTHRIRSGTWEWPYVVDRKLGALNKEAFERLSKGKTPAEIDDIVQYPLLWKPGDLATSEDYPRNVRDAHKRIFGEPALDLDSFLHARVRSRSGIVAGLQVKHQGKYAYSAEVRVLIATLAELASLALS
jgi:transcriptional regulator with XRE-family HTH domain